VRVVRLFLLVVFVAALGAGCGHIDHAIRGTFSFQRNFPVGTADKSVAPPTKNFEDIRAGASVVVKDAKGKILATGTLQEGKVTILRSETYSNFTYLVGRSSYPFALVVPDSDFYSIEVSHRGAVIFTKAQLSADNWMADITIGNSS
jgi:hypothetical protein